MRFTALFFFTLLVGSLFSQNSTQGELEVLKKKIRQSTYFDGVISAVNKPAAAKGVKIGQAAKDAARLLLA